jgi:penicillin-binding protein 1A
VRIDRWLLIRLAIAGLAGAALFPFALYYVGLAVAPPPPVPTQTPVPPLIADALWARADGGRNTALTPMTHLTMAQFAACIAIEDFKDTTPGDARRVAACQRYMPALLGVEYLAGLHMRDANLKPSFREGLGRLSTTIWLTHSWKKDEFLGTLAERGEVGAGFRGVEAAAQGYFGRAAAQLTLPQAALIGAFMGDRRVDPWCDPESAAGMRRRVLERMRDNLAIDDAAFQAANVTELGLGPPPADHKSCVE